MAQPTITTTTKIIEKCHISPPSGSVPPINLPLTFFDIPFLAVAPVHSLFFFDLSLPTHLFTLTVLPKLKHSLSLALRHFFPFAADLVLPAPPHKPHLLFSEGGSVSFTVAESTADFHHLISNDPRDVTEFHPFVPTLPPPSSDEGGASVSSTLAIQVTVFPNSGISIGSTFNHVAADGRALHHFIKSWAFFCRNISSTQAVDLVSPPCHVRNIISGILPICLKDLWAMMSELNQVTHHHHHQPQNIARDSFIMTRTHITKLKQRLMARFNDKEEESTLHLSTFVVTVAYVWVHLVKSKQETKDDETCHLAFPADCRNRKGFKVQGSEYSIPDTYFGNCLTFCHVSLARSEIVGENGIFCAAKAIGERIKEFHKEPLKGRDKWMSGPKEIPKLGNLVSVAGSPRFKEYDTDFGWGRPSKYLMAQKNVTRSILFTECKDEEGGIEITLALERDKLGMFNVAFQQGLGKLL